jgi:hypothetical protein
MSLLRHTIAVVVLVGGLYLALMLVRGPRR